MIFRLLIFILATLPAFGASRVFLTVQMNSVPVDGNSLTVNGTTHTWKDTVLTSATQIQIAGSTAANTTNLWLHTASNPFTGALAFQWTDSTHFKLASVIDGTISASLAGTWATLTLSTQTVTTATSFRLPLEAEPSTTVRTNNANNLISGVFNSDVGTTAVKYDSLPMVNFANKTAAQTFNGAITMANGLTLSTNANGTTAQLFLTNTRTNAAVGGSEISFKVSDQANTQEAAAGIVGQKADSWTSTATKLGIMSLTAATNAATSVGLTVQPGQVNVYGSLKVRNLSPDSTTNFYVGWSSGYSGLGSKYLADDGTYKSLATGVSYDTLASALAATPSSVNPLVNIRARATANDGGGGDFVWLASSALATNLGTVFDGSGGYQLVRIYSGPVDIRWFGAKPGTSTDTSPMLRSATTVITGAKVWFPKGNYKFLSEVEIGSSHLIGEGDGTELDFSTATTLTNGCLVATGTLSALPGPGSSIAAGAKTVSFASSPSLSEGDYYLVWNATDSSYSAARTVYRHGEMFQVSGRSGSTVTNTSRAFAAYTSGGTNILLYKMNVVTPKISNLKVIGFNNGSSANHYPAVKFIIATGLLADNVLVRDSEYAQIILDRCYNAAVSNARLFDVTDHSIGLNYGLKIDNSQRITALNLFASTTRHGLSIGGSDAIGGIIDREISIIGGAISSSTGVTYGLDFHGDAEFVTVSGVNLPSGISLAADHTTITGCVIGNDNDNGSAVADQGEIVGFNHNIVGNEITATRNSTGSLIGFYPRSYTTRTNGTYTVANNKINLAGYTFTDGGMTVYPVGGTNDFAVQISGNSIGGSAENYGITLKQTTYGISRAAVFNNTLTGSGVFFHSDIRDLDIRGNTIFTPQLYGIYSTVASGASWSNNVWNISANHINRATKTGIRLVPPAAITATLIGNSIWNSAQSPAGDSSDAGIYINAGSTVVVRDNHIADFEGHQLYAYTLDGITNVFRQINTLIGKTNVYPGVNVNEYKASATGVIYSPFADNYKSATALTYDEASQGVGVGSAPYGDYNTPLYVRRQTNALSRIVLQNDIALGNTSAGAQMLLLSKNSSGFVAAYPSDNSNSSYADNLVVGLNSDATYLTLSAESGTQRVQARAAGGHDTYVGSTRQLAIDSTGIYAYTNIYNGTVGWFKGSGSPEGSVSAVVGSMYSRTDGGAGTSLYVKESGSGSTGWVGK